MLPHRPVLPRSHHPAHDRPDLLRICRCLDEVSTIAVDRTLGSMPEQVGITQLLDVRRSGHGKNRVMHAPPQVVDSRSGLLSFREERIMQVGQREHRHPIAVTVEACEVRVTVRPPSTIALTAKACHATASHQLSLVGGEQRHLALEIAVGALHAAINVVLSDRRP